MRFFKSIIFKFKLNQAKKQALVLCRKMLELYNYFIATHPGSLRPSDSVKEVVPFAPGWKNASKNVFRHVSGGIIEVKAEDDLESTVAKMAAAETKILADRFPRVASQGLDREILTFIKEFFRINKPR